MNNLNENEARILPILPLRGLNIFPGMLLNFDVERSISLAALNYAMNNDQIIFLATQKDIATDVPMDDDIYTVGMVCRIRQMVRQPGGKPVDRDVVGKRVSHSHRLELRGGHLNLRSVQLYLREKAEFLPDVKHVAQIILIEKGDRRFSRTVEDHEFGKRLV